ncbi:hypothetical protein GW755_02255 [bacterium]|nr:hypothetical protein [bacterium]
MKSLPEQLKYSEEETGFYYNVEFWKPLDPSLQGYIAELSFIYAPSNGTRLFEHLIEQIEFYVREEGPLLLEFQPTTPDAQRFIKTLESVGYEFCFQESQVYSEVYTYSLYFV